MSFTLADYDELMASKPLTSIMLNATNECNFACPYCFTTPNPMRMSVDTAKAVILWSLDHHNPDLGTLHINWFGGEPTLEYESLIKPIVKWSYENDFKVDFGMTSNCSLLTEEMLEFFKEYKISILCSIDGVPEVQNLNRPLKNGGASWPLLKRNFDKLIKYPYVSGFRPTVTPLSGRDLFNAYCMARQNGFFMFFPGLDSGDKTWTEEDKLKTEEELFYIGMNIYDDIANKRYPMEVPPIIDALNVIIRGNYSDPIVPRRCGLGTVSMGFGPDGTLFACQEHSTYEKGDKFEIGSVFTGIDRQKHYNLIKEYLDMGVVPLEERNEKCKTCMLSNHCYSDICPSMSYLQSGHFGFGSEIWCWWNQTLLAVARAMILRADMEKDTSLIEYVAEYMHLPVNVKDILSRKEER